MIGLIDIDGWAAGIAEAEAESVRQAVHDALMMGHGASSALRDVSRRLDRLTIEQRRMVIDEIRSVSL